MAVGEVYEVDVQYHVHERPLHLGLWFEVLTDPTTPSATAHDLAQAVDSNGLIQFLRTIVGNETVFDQIRAYKRFDENGITEQGPIGRKILQVQQGDISGEALPDNAPMQINWIQSAISSKANGRGFLSGVPESQTAKNVLIDSFRTGFVQNFIDNWTSTLLGITGPLSGVYRQVVVSKHPDAPPPTNATYGAALDVTAVSVAPIIRQQRRRQTRWEGTTF